MDLAATLATMPFAVATGIELESATADEVRGRLAWADDRCTIGGLMHGGALMTLADSVGAVCAFLNLPAGASTSTIESKTNFMRGCARARRSRRPAPYTSAARRSWCRPTYATARASASRSSPRPKP